MMEPSPYDEGQAVRADVRDSASVIERRLDRLHKEVTVLGENVSILHARLGFVLLPDTPMEVRAERDQQDASSGLSSVLASLADSVGLQSEILRRIMERLEL